MEIFKQKKSVTAALDGFDLQSAVEASVAEMNKMWLIVERRECIGELRLMAGSRRCQIQLVITTKKEEMLSKPKKRAKKEVAQ